MLDRLTTPLFVARTFAGAGLIHPERPDRLVRALGKLRDWGPTVAGGYQAAAARRPDAVAIVDERGTLTFREIDERTNRLAHALAGRGHRPRRRRRDPRAATTAASSTLGRARQARRHALYLNTMFAAPADHRRLRAREAGRDRPRRGVRRVRRRRRPRAASASSPGTTARTRTAP